MDFFCIKFRKGYLKVNGDKNFTVVSTKEEATPFSFTAVDRFIAKNGAFLGQCAPIRLDPPKMMVG